MGIHEGLGVRQRHRASRTATRLEHGIGIRRVALVEENRRPGAGRYDDLAGSAYERVVDCHAGHAAHGR